MRHFMVDRDRWADAVSVKEKIEECLMVRMVRTESFYTKKG